MPDLLILGSVNRDLIVHAPVCLLAGETLRGQPSSLPSVAGRQPGRGRAHLGAQVALVARVGLREGAGALVAQLAREGVSRRTHRPAGTKHRVRPDRGWRRGWREPDRHRRRLQRRHAGGPGRSLALAGVRWIVAQQELPPASIARCL